jgi:hypothetical protein
MFSWRNVRDVAMFLLKYMLKVSPKFRLALVGGKHAAEPNHAYKVEFKTCSDLPRDQPW